MITLQAIAFALEELGHLPAPERALGCDRAELGIAHAARTLSAAWDREPMPNGLLDLLAEAQRALRLARTLAFCFVVDANDIVMPRIDPAAIAAAAPPNPGSELWLAPPGVTFARGAVVAWSAPEPIDLDLAGVVRTPIAVPAMQLYRQPQPAPLDLCAPVAVSLPAGLPMLRPIIENGETLQANWPKPVAALDRAPPPAAWWVRDEAG